LECGISGLSIGLGVRISYALGLGSALVLRHVSGWIVLPRIMLLTKGAMDGNERRCGHVYKVTWCAECCPPNPHAYTPTASGTPYGPGGSEVRAITVGRTVGAQPVSEDAQEREGIMGMVVAGVALGVAYLFWKRR
jgi:hypothetical protein